jgi:hypothetical protein
MKRLIKLNGGKKDEECAHVLLVLDDCVSDVNFHTAKAFEKLFTRGRHIKISLIITTQYPYLIPPVARINTDYISSYIIRRNNHLKPFFYFLFLDANIKINTTTHKQNMKPNNPQNNFLIYDLIYFKDGNLIF